MQHVELVRVTAGAIFFLLVALLLWRRWRKRQCGESEVRVKNKREATADSSLTTPKLKNVWGPAMLRMTAAIMGRISDSGH